MTGDDAASKIWITTENPAVLFENTEVGRLKKEIWDASEDQIDGILGEYGIPSPPEIGLPETYIQTTPRAKIIENRRKNDIVLIPVGCTENHGRHTVSALDSFMVTQIAEGVRRFTTKQGIPVSLAFNPLNYGGHPYQHSGVPGTVIIPQEIVKELMVYVMLGLWNDGFRKQIIINNHGQLWILEAALHEFMFRFQLPGVFQIIDWHRAVREFFHPKAKEDSLETPFIHADEAETSIALLLFPKGMVRMELTEETEPKGLLPLGHFDDSVETFRRPHRWSEGVGHFAIELAGTPEGVVGSPRLGDARKAKRPIAAILRYLTLCINQLLNAFPPGTVPPVELMTHRKPEELEPYLREPQSPGWKSVYSLPKTGV